MSDRKQNQPTDSTLMILYTVYTGRKGGNGGKFQILGFKDTLEVPMAKITTVYT